MATKKDREREAARRQRSKDWLQSWQKEPKADPPILTADELNTQEVIILIRTSREHSKVGKLFSQEEGVRKELAALGIVAVRVFSNHETGKTLNKEDRPALHAAIERAKKLKLPVVAACPSRFLRHPDFTIHTPDLYPTKKQWDELLEMADGVTLAVCRMTKNNDEDELLLTMMGKNHPPPPKKTKEWVAKKVRKLHSKGYSYREIAERMTTHYDICMSHMTAKRIVMGK